MIPNAGTRMNQLNFLFKTLAAMLVGAFFISLPAHAQQTNPNKLRPCPKPDYSKKTDIERFAKWTNCWGRYQVAVDKDHKDDVLEGEWLNGWQHGQGSYTYASGAKYVGEFKDGIKNGQGTYTFASGDKYVGEFKDDDKHGLGTYTFASGDKYVGEHKDGKSHGQGTYTHANGNKYVGEYKDGNKTGWGTYTFASGDKYVGEHQDNKENGLGTYTKPNGFKYVGEFKDGEYHGRGIGMLADGTRFEGIWADGKFIREAKVNLPTLNNNIATNNDRTDIDRERQHTNPNKLRPCPKPDYSKKTDIERFAKWTNCWGRYQVELDKDHKGDVLEIEWLNGLPHGLGTYTYANGDKYVGEFKHGSNHGQGTYTYANGDKYVGKYKDGKKHGQGAYISANGNKYVGEHKDDKKNGQGTYTWASGAKYVGEHKDDKENGLGTYTWPNGDRHVGEFKDGDFHGQGERMSADGTRIEGVWADGKFIREAKVNLPNLNNNIATNTDRTDIDRERQQLAEERRRLEEEKRQREQAKSSQRINLQVTNTQPTSDGSFFIEIKTNADTASLQIDGKEEGGKVDGNYIIKRVARAGSASSFRIVATDVYGNTENKTINVSRAIVESKTTYAALNPGQVKQQSTRDAVAIIIGIAEYKNLPKADFANDDARAFYDYAIRALGVKPENIKLLVDSDADEAEILRTFRNWLPSKVKPTTDVYVFYSGHGLPTTDGQSLYLIPPRAAKDVIDDTAIPFSKINAAIQSAKPKSVTMILDACYSGQARTGETLLASARPVQIKTENRLFPENFTVITASQNDQISSSNPDLQHGIFSYYLMKGMEGDADANKDGKITLGEMQAYLVENVGRQAGMMSRKQEPQLVGDPNRVLVGR